MRLLILALALTLHLHAQQWKPALAFGAPVATVVLDVESTQHCIRAHTCREATR